MKKMTHKVVLVDYQKEQMTYRELVNIIEKEIHIKHKFDVVAFLIGYQGVVTTEDFHHILKLFDDGFVD